MSLIGLPDVFLAQLIYGNPMDAEYLNFNRDRSCNYLAYLFTNDCDGAVALGAATIRMTDGLNVAVTISEFSVEYIYRATVADGTQSWSQSAAETAEKLSIQPDPTRSLNVQDT